MRKVKALVEKTEILKQNVYQRLPCNMPELEEIVVHAQLAQHKEVKKCQQTKFQWILNTNAKKTDIMGPEGSNLASEIMPRCMKNYSDRLLSDPELSVLKKGLNTSQSSSCGDGDCNRVGP